MLLVFLAKRGCRLLGHEPICCEVDDLSLVLRVALNPGQHGIVARTAGRSAVVVYNLI